MRKKGVRVSLLALLGNLGVRPLQLKRFKVMAYGLWLKNAKPYRKKICQVSKTRPLQIESILISASSMWISTSWVTLLA